MSKEGLKSITITKTVSDCLSLYSEKIGINYNECLAEFIADYIGVLGNVQSRYYDRGLKKIYNEFEYSYKKFNDHLRKERQIVIEDAFLTRVLDGEKIYVNPPSERRKIPIIIYEQLKKVIESNPNLYNEKKKTKISDIVDRSILFRIIDNDELINNPAYREWRLQRMLISEKSCKLKWDYLFENLKW